MTTRYAVIGGGILGLATAHRITQEQPGAPVTVIEKETAVGLHQTGHNSGVIHAGVYYKPGSLKADLCRDGGQAMVDFCIQHNIPVNVCGKLIVATDDSQIDRLHALHQRSLANGLSVRMLSPAEAREHEPNVASVAAMHVKSTAITDFGMGCQVLADLVEKSGATIMLGAKATGIRQEGSQTRIDTTSGAVTADVLINCAGLHSDRVARLAGVDPGVQIVPFRGEYYELKPGKRHLIKGLIYPVPDPQFPFLGVHFTRMIDGSVHAGPNAVLALGREGYRWSRINLRDLGQVLTFGGTWRLGRKHWRYGLVELHRSMSAKRFAASLARLVPAVAADDLVPCEAGVRAQAIARDGSLVDDFLIKVHGRQVHVLNAPSPAATSSLAIAKHILKQIP